jgi:hypothetical protein
MAVGLGEAVFRAAKTTLGGFGLVGFHVPMASNLALASFRNRSVKACNRS